MKDILIATRNQHKLREIKAILKKSLHRQRIRLLSADKPRGGTPPAKRQRSPVPYGGVIPLRRLPKVKEDGRTYRANALKKARTLARLTGLPVLAEDSGIEVAALKNRPGIYSARYAGPKANARKNNRKLLKALTGLSASRRQARYRCVAVFINPLKNKIVITEGVCYGMITEKLCGHKGFGYDPIFIPRHYQRTFGQLPASLKNHISHRARAFNKMARYL